MEPISPYLTGHVEALVFCSPQPLAAADIQLCLSELLGAEVPLAEVERALAHLAAAYRDSDRAIQLVQAGGGYQFLSKPAYEPSVNILLRLSSKKRLSNAALETIAIIAYKQPVTKAQLEQVRGVGCDYAIQKLLEKELIEIKGKSDGVGRPLLYGTTQKFMDYFGLNSLKDLPQPKDLADEVNEIGPATLADGEGG
jgi:segregation and condensation protein B